ncbi:MAG: STAS domain-containing protein [Cyclobacteriaceae bacterium]
MQFKSEVSENVLLIHLEGDLIGENNGPQILDKASEHILKGITHAIINLESVRYINSSGIGVLITILTKFRNSGGEVYLVNPSEHVQKLLIITKLEAIFSIEQSNKEAMAKIKNS